jgi:hypothetical protein
VVLRSWRMSSEMLVEERWNGCDHQIDGCNKVRDGGRQGGRQEKQIKLWRGGWRKEDETPGRKKRIWV